MIGVVVLVFTVIAVGTFVYVCDLVAQRFNELQKECDDLNEYNQVLVSQLAHERELKQKIAEDNMALIEENATLRDRWC